MHLVQPRFSFCLDRNLKEKTERKNWPNLLIIFHFELRKVRFDSALICFYFRVCYTYILTTRKGVNDDRLVYNACNSYIVGMFVL